MQIFGTTTPSPSISGVVVAIYEIGAFVGAVSVLAFGILPRDCQSQRNHTEMKLGQVLGRRVTTAIGQVVTIIGAALQATSFSLGQMIAARIITGVGTIVAQK